jgi:hypothetical protein
MPQSGRRPQHQTRSPPRCPLHDRSSTESGSPPAILLCRKSARRRPEQVSPSLRWKRCRLAAPGSRQSRRPNSLLTGKLTGNFEKSGLSVAISCPINARIQCLTAEFPTQQNREFSNACQGIFFGEQGNLIKRERDAVIAVRGHLVGEGADAFHLPICRL